MQVEAGLLPKLLPKKMGSNYWKGWFQIEPVEIKEVQKVLKLEVGFKSPYLYLQLLHGTVQGAFRVSIH